jgi:hypothetical protein
LAAIPNGQVEMTLGLLSDPEESWDPEVCREDILNAGNTVNPPIVNKDRFKNVFRFMLCGF